MVTVKKKSNSLTTKKLEELKYELQTLEEDFSAQYNALRARGDVDWDCYDRSNWKNSHSMVMRIAKMLSIKLDSNLEN